MRLFAYRLAKELGEWDVDGMLSAMTAKQLRGWLAYFDAEPFGEDRRDFGNAIVAHTMAACWSKRPPSIYQFMPFVKRPKVDPKARMENSKANVRAFLSAMNRKSNGKDDHRQTECDPDA